MVARHYVSEIHPGVEPRKPQHAEQPEIETMVKLIRNGGGPDRLIW